MINTALHFAHNPGCWTDQEAATLHCNTLHDVVQSLQAKLAWLSKLPMWRNNNSRPSFDSFDQPRTNRRGNDGKAGVDVRVMPSAMCCLHVHCLTSPLPVYTQSMHSFSPHWQLWCTDMASRSVCNQGRAGGREPDLHLVHIQGLLHCLTAL